MNKAEFSRSLAFELGISTGESDLIVEKLVLVMGRALARHESVVLSNFGTLQPVRRSPRSFSPRVSAREVKPDSVKVRFKAADRLLEAVKAGDDRVTFRKRSRELPRAS